MGIYKATPTVEQIRIDFVEFDIAAPKLGACSNESMTIMGADAVTNKILPDKLCGVLTGQHLYLSVKDLGTDFLTIEITLSSNRGGCNSRPRPTRMSPVLQGGRGHLLQLQLRQRDADQRQPVLRLHHGQRCLLRRCSHCRWF